MTDQTIKVSGESTAIQSGRDTHITQGITTADMKQIIESLAAQLPAYAAVAAEIVDGRLKEFEARVLERFSDEKAARRDAFKDPDFQFLIGRAQQAYARSGDEIVRETLVDLITQRAKQKDRTRLALSLNEAVERAAVMTHNEFAELSLAYLLKYTRHIRIANLDAFATYLNTQVAPLLPDVSIEHSSYSYLESQSCASIVNFTNSTLLAIFRKNYGGLFAKGITNDEIKVQLPEGKKGALDNSGLVIPCLNDVAKFQLNAISNEVFHSEAERLHISLSSAELDKVWNAMEATMWSEEEMIQNLTPKVPCIGELFRLWKETPLHRLQLTPVGIAIGYGNLVRVSRLEADLSIWIK